MNRHTQIKLSLLLAALGAVLACIALLLAGPVKADRTDDAFLNLLHSEGIHSANGDAGLIVAAHGVCADRYSGYGELAEASRVMASNPGLSAFESGFFVGAAELAYCPSMYSHVSGQSA